MAIKTPGRVFTLGPVSYTHLDVYKRQVKAFEIAGYSEETVIERFGGMYRAFQYGAPPHGGMAAGVDRVIMLLAGEQNLREVALFPMNQRAEDILMGAPSPASNQQLRDLHVLSLIHI